MLKEIKAQVMVRIAQETREEWEGAARGEKGETGRLGLVSVCWFVPGG